MRFEINFIWDCQDPSEIIVYKGTVLDNIKAWHDYIPVWLEKIESHFRDRPLPDAPLEMHPRNIYINLWLGPHLSAKSRSKIQSWATLLPRLRLININPEWDITATYVAKPPFWNPGNASDIWRLLVLARDKNMGEEDIVRIYMDTDIMSETPWCIGYPGHFAGSLTRIEENIRESGMMFFEPFHRKVSSSDSLGKYCQDRVLVGKFVGNNNALVVFDIEKFRKFLGNNLKFEDYCWITFPRDHFKNITSLAARIKYLYATTPMFKHTCSSFSIYDSFSWWSPAKSTLHSSGPNRLVKLCNKLVASSYNKDNAPFYKPGTCYWWFSPVIAASAEKYFLNPELICNSSASTWLDKSRQKKYKGVLRAKKYTMISELAYDIADRLDFEIRHFREYNLPFALLLALSYRQLVNEANIVEFATLVFGYLIPRVRKYRNPFYLFSGTLKAAKTVEFHWLKGITPYLEAKKLPRSDDLARNISILERNETQILAPSNSGPIHTEIPISHAIKKGGPFTGQPPLPLLPMYPPKVGRDGFKNLNTVHKAAWGFIEKPAGGSTI